MSWVRKWFMQPNRYVDQQWPETRSEYAGGKCQNSKASFVNNTLVILSLGHIYIGQVMHQHPLGP